MDSMIANTNTQALRSIPNCFRNKDGEITLFDHTHSPDASSPHPASDHPGRWNELLQNRHYSHRHPHSNCATSLRGDNGVVNSDVDVGDLNANVEARSCEWGIGLMDGMCSVA